MPTVTLTRGLPGSGKTTAARALVDASGGTVRRVNLDDLRRMAGAPRGTPGSGIAAEESVLQIQDAAILANLDAGFDTVVDNTHISPRIPNRIKRLLLGRARIEVLDLTGVPTEECIRRDAARPEPVGEDAVRHMAARLASVRKSGVRLDAETLNDLPAPHPYAPDPALPKAIVCDIDGTLALHNGRGPFDLDRLEEDLPNPAVLHLVRTYRSAGIANILLSGRERGERDRHRIATQRWLARLDDPYDEFHQRPAGDTRPDDVVKLELFDRHIRGRFDVLFVLDDRDRLVRLWRRGLHLACLQANYGAF